MKIRKLKRMLLIQTVILLGVLSGLGGLAWFLSDQVEASSAQKNALRGDVAGIENQTSALQNKVKNFQGGSPEYRHLMTKEGDEEFQLNRSLMRPLFDKLQLEFALGDMAVALEPVKETQEAKYRKTRSVLLSSQGSLNFRSFHDEQTVAFLHALQNRLPAMVKISKLRMAQLDQNKANMAKTDSAFTTDPRLDNAVAFEWMGFKDPNPPKPAPAGAPSPPQGAPAP